MAYRWDQTGILNNSCSTGNKNWIKYTNHQENMTLNQVTTPELTGQQCLWTLNLSCIPHMRNYWARRIPLNLTAKFCTRVVASTQLTSTTLTPVTLERRWFLVKYKGMGLRSLYDQRHSEYVRGMVQGILPLLNWLFPSDITITWRIHTPSMERWLGLTLLSGDPDKKPWDLSNGIHSNIAIGLQDSYKALQNEVININRRHEMDAPIYLFNNPVDGTGFYMNSISYPSITK